MSEIAAKLQLKFAIVIFTNTVDKLAKIGYNKIR